MKVPIATQDRVRNRILERCVPLVTQYIHDSSRIVAYLRRLTTIVAYPYFYAEQFIQQNKLNTSALKDDMIEFLGERRPPTTP